MADSGTPGLDRERLQQIGAGRLPGYLGIEVLETGAGRLRAALAVKPELHAPNGYLHAGAIVTLADTAAGYGCITNLPAGANNFTTVELKSNFLGTLREGRLLADATLAHGGRTTQVWDVVVTAEGDGRTLALFRCTQLVLYPKH